MPQYGSRTGKLLTPEERLVLLENTARFIETLEAERLELERVAALAAIKRQQEESVRAAKELRSQTHQALHQFQHPQHIADEARSSLYEGPEMLRWRWKSTEERVASITEYKANPAGGPHHACVVRCLKAEVQPTPYLFALDVELSQRLPKRYIFRVLDDLNLIQRI
jgi:hypothetical protein